MGCASSTGTGGCASLPESDEELKASLDLEREILKERLQELFNFKILLLGAGESGKSTIVKQLRMIHNKPPTPHELVTIGDSLHQNVIDCMKALLYAMEKFGYEHDTEQDKTTAEMIINFDESRRIAQEEGALISTLYLSKAAKSAYARRNEFWLLDSCSYYMNNLERFTEIGFTPTPEDQVMARVRTTGIVVSHLEHKIANGKPDEPDTMQFQVVDVGGQRNERKKWIHCFDDVKALLFIVNLAGYNQVLFEDTSKNRMHEELELFQEVTRKPVFKDTPLFLFLNKKDLFETMLGEKDLVEAFPDYNGGQNVQTALHFIRDKFLAVLAGNKVAEAEAMGGPPDKIVQVASNLPNRKLLIFDVTGVWKRDIKCAFEDIKGELMKINRKYIDQEKLVIKREEKLVQKRARRKGNAIACCTSA